MSEDQVIEDRVRTTATKLAGKAIITFMMGLRFNVTMTAGGRLTRKLEVGGGETSIRLNEKSFVYHLHNEEVYKAVLEQQVLEPRTTVVQNKQSESR